MDDNTLKTFAYISISSYRIKAIKAMNASMSRSAKTGSIV